MKGPACLAACRILLLFLAAAQTASGQVNGAIFTTFSDGSTVNGNIYPAKDKVYISGGPQNEHPKGLSPDGVYYFQVTDPSGAVLLSTDDVTCRQVVVSGGRIVRVPAGAAPASCTEPAGSTTPGAFHNVGTADPNSGQTPVQLCAPSGCPAGSPDFKDTPDAGGEYKVWVTPVANFGEACKKGHSSFGFCDSDSKTDNFKVKKPAMATVTVCKFNDQNDNGLQDVGEPLIPHWPITATGVVGDTGSGFSTQTDDSGCVSFSVASFTNGSATVTLQEGTLGPDWTRTAPNDGACTLTGTTVNSADTCSAVGGVITISVNPGDDVNTSSFGNFNPNCTAGCTGQQLLVTKTAHPVTTYTWKIQKSVDNTVIDTSGSATANYTVTASHDNGTATMTGNIRVSNPFGPDLSGITVTDAVSDAATDGGACTVTTPSDVTAGDGTITVGAGTHVDATYSCTFSNVPAAGTNTNTATATWAAGAAAGNASFDFSTATIVDGSVSVTDSLQGSLGTVSIDNTGNVTTTPNAPVTSSGPGIFNYSLTFNDPTGTCTTHNNTATFTTSTTGTTGSDSKSVKVCVGADLTVSKTATTAFTSGIQKTVDRTVIDTSSGSAATFNYTVTVTESAWKVSGNITVTNPNDWESITATVTDLLSDAGGICIVNGGSNVITLAASSSQTLAYSCSFSSAPAASGANTGTATWDKAVAFTTDRSTSGIANYAFGTLTVTDSFNGNLGTVSTPAASTSFTYPRTISAPTATCSTFPNTATIVETNQTASQSVKVCGASDLTVSKTATPMFNSNIAKTVDNAQLNTFSGGNVTFNYTVTATESGWNVSGNITANNPNDWEDITANFADSLSGGNCTITNGTAVVVPASGSATRAYSCTFASAPGASGVNSATATWDPAAAFTAHNSATGSASFTFGSLTITDSFKGSLGIISAPAASTVFTYSRTITAPTATCATFPNTATIVETNQTASQSVKVCGASDLTVSKTATPAFNSNIAKTVDNAQLNTFSGGNVTFNYTVTATESGWNVSGNITANNPNDWENITANFADLLSGGNCTITNGTAVVVPASGSATRAYSCTFASAPGASGTNSATATWDLAAAFTAHNSATGSASFTFGSLTITDSFKGSLGIISAPAASTVFTYSRTITAPTATCSTFPNTATIVETNQTASQSVKVCGASDLAVTKSAVATFDSNIVKNVDKTQVEQAGGTITFTYTIAVTESAWKVSGNIMVTNPNDWESITANIGDALSIAGGACTITGGGSVTVGASGSVSLPYVCTFSSAPAASGVNTATASWNKATFFTPDASSSGSAGFAFGALTVTDAFNGGAPVTLGTISVPTVSTTFTDIHTVNNTIGGTCQSFNNTATILPTNQTSSRTVTVCNAATGALTMGFWQNKNGQAILTGGAATGGVCNSGSFLRTFNPFQDLSATATCSQVAAYVTNIIKAANASGTSMNAMLKAQMLATALDVFFSDPTLGGNLIGAATPLGTVKIDLTQVAQMIDSSTGSLCSCNRYDVSALSFGGNRSLTVAAMLTFAASQSNGDGSIWYGQNKTVQQGAKDAFDEINNQVAFIAP